MKKTIKKGLMGLGTAVSIVTPIATIVSCGTTKNTINWSDDDSFGGITGGNFLQEIKHLGKTNQDSIKIAKEQMMQVQYESESIRSLKAQQEQFKFQVWQLGLDVKKLEEDQTQAEKDLADASAADDDTKDGFQSKLDGIKNSIKDKNDEVTKINKFIAKITAAIAGVDFTKDFIKTTDTVTSFYSDDDKYNETDYPLIYKPLDTIREDKSKIVNDAYRNFYPQFTTREDGDREWPSELAKTYGGAATFSQAIDYLVGQEISSKAFNSFQFEINKSFTVEQKLWNDYIEKGAFSFLDNAAHSEDLDDDIKLIGDTKDDIEANIVKINQGKSIGSASSEKIVKSSVLTSEEIFIASKSPDHRMSDEAYSKLDSVVKYQHMLIKATQGATTDDVWTITGDDLTKLMSYQHVKGPTGEIVKDGTYFLSSDDLFGTSEDQVKETDFILKSISGNSEGTVKIQGSLGIKTELEYLKAMVPGFSLGALAITQGIPSSDPQPPAPAEIDLEVLSTALKDALAKEVSNAHTTIPVTVDATNMDATNIDIAATIKALGDDKVKTIFGRVFKDFFAGKTDLVYKVKGTTNNYLVVSQFGIHIIKRVSYASDKIKDAVELDIKNMAKDSSLPSSTGIVDELTQAYSDSKIMETLLSDADFKEILTTKLEEYNKDKNDEVDKVEINHIEQLIKTINSLKARTDLDEAMGDKLENWLVTQIDAGLRTLPSGTTLDDIYGWAQKAGGN